MNKTIVATTIHDEYKDVLLNKKYLRYSMKRIQSKDHRVATYTESTGFLCLALMIQIQYISKTIDTIE